VEEAHAQVAFSSCVSAWLAACGVMPCAAAAWRRLPSSAALVKVAMARSSLKAIGTISLDLLNEEILG
jgi:hypothetical protein